MPDGLSRWQLRQHRSNGNTRYCCRHQRFARAILQVRASCRQQGGGMSAPIPLFVHTGLRTRPHARSLQQSLVAYSFASPRQCVNRISMVATILVALDGYHEVDAHDGTFMRAMISSSASAFPRASSPGLWVCRVLRRSFQLEWSPIFRRSPDQMSPMRRALWPNGLRLSTGTDGCENAWK